MKAIIAIALAFTVLAGAATMVIAVQPQPAYADCGNGKC